MSITDTKVRRHKVSVALCTYNGEKFIEKQINSILNQSSPVDEIVVIDDCSQDSTYAILQSLASKYPQINLTKNVKNIGFIKNFEEAIKRCKGDYIFLSDQDDIWCREKVEVVVKHCEETGVWGVFTNAFLIDETDKIIGSSLFQALNMEEYLSQKTLEPDLFTMLCMNDNFVTGATIAIKKEAKKVLLPFHTSTYIYHDFFIALKLAARDTFSVIGKPLIYYRLHQNQHVGLGESSEERECLFLKLMEVFSKEKDPRETISYLLRRRRDSVNVIHDCRFTLKDYLLLKRSYGAIIMSLLRRLSWKRKIMLYISYAKTECYVLLKTILSIFYYPSK